MNNKKGMASAYFAVIIVIVMLLGMFTVALMSSARPVLEEWGGHEQALLAAYHDAEKRQLFVENAARYSAYEACRELFENAGGIDTGVCGTYNGIPVIDTEKRECAPAKAEERFFEMVSGRIDSYISSSGLKIPMGNYEFVMDKTTIFGQAINDMDVTVEGMAQTGLKEFKKGEIGSVLVRPSFKVDSGCRPDLFLSVYDMVRMADDGCAGAVGSEGCFFEKISEYGALIEGIELNEGYCGGVAKGIAKRVYESINGCVDNDIDSSCYCRILPEKFEGAQGEYKIGISADGTIVAEHEGRSVSFKAGPVNGGLNFMEDKDETQIGVDYIQLHLAYSGGVLEEGSMSVQASSILGIRDYGSAMMFKNLAGKAAFIGKGDGRGCVMGDKPVVVCARMDGKRMGAETDGFLWESTGYELAVRLRDGPPLPLAGLKQMMPPETGQASEGIVYLKWNDPVDGSISEYRIYVSREDMDGYEIDSGKAMSNGRAALEAAIFDVRDEILIGFIDLQSGPRCEAFLNGKRCRHKYNARDINGDEILIELERDRLYHMRESGEYLLLLSGFDDVSGMNIIVSAADSEGREISNLVDNERIEAGKNYLRNVKSVDTLPPARVESITGGVPASNQGSLRFIWPDVGENIDGSEVIDGPLYELYASSQPEFLFSTSELVLSTELNKIDEVGILQKWKGNTVYFFVVARDDDGNAVTDGIVSKPISIS